MYVWAAEITGSLLDKFEFTSSTKCRKSSRQLIDFALNFAAKIDLRSFPEGPLMHPKPRKIDPKAVLRHPGAPRDAQRGSGSNLLFNFSLFWTILGSPLAPKSRSKIGPWSQKGRQEAISDYFVLAKNSSLTFGRDFPSIWDENTMDKSMQFSKAARNFFNLATPWIYAQEQWFEYFSLFSCLWNL